MNEQKNNNYEEKLKECTFQPNLVATAHMFSTVQSKTSAQKCVELYQLARPKSEDVAADECSLRKEVKEYTFRPAILKQRPKSSQGDYLVKGKDKNVERHRVAQQVNKTFSLPVADF